MAHSSSRDGNLSLGSRKLVVLGIPWDIDTEGLRQYMLRFGELDDVIVMKDRATGRSRGFGYVTFSSADNAQKAVSTQHSLNGRMLEVKVATPREEMKPPAKKITRVFVARIPPIVTDEMFRRYSFVLCLGLVSLS
jgi:RNA-binding protein Musashi